MLFLVHRKLFRFLCKKHTNEETKHKDAEFYHPGWFLTMNISKFKKKGDLLELENVKSFNASPLITALLLVFCAKS